VRGRGADVISSTGEYALRAAVYLAQHRDAPQTTAKIAEGTKVPAGYLSKILQQLVRGEIASSLRGAHGGFVLLHDPDAVTVWDVLTAVGAAPERIETCPLGIERHEGLCPVHRLVDDAVAEAQRCFSSATLATLVSSVDGMTALCEVAPALGLPARGGSRR